MAQFEVDASEKTKMRNPRVSNGFLRYIVLFISTIILLWLSIGVTLDLAFGKDRPGFARLWWPFGVTSLIGAATALVGENATKADSAQAAILARAALAREPVSAASARTLGIASALQDHKAEADESFIYAEQLSRRDIPTQLYLLEREVSRGNIDGALVHYDRALRTSLASRPVLLPALAKASEDPVVAKSLAHVLRRRPAWWFDFMWTLIPTVQSPSSLALQVEALRLVPSADYDRDILIRSMARLVELKAYDLAARLSPDHVTTTALRDGDFENSTALPPFGWTLRDDGDVSASREPNTSGHAKFVLRLTSTAERGGTVASQLMILKPGTYQLTGITGDGPAQSSEAPALSVVCIESGASLGARSLAAPVAGAAQRFTLTFVVPDHCAAQTLKVDLAATSNVNAWLDAIDIRQIRRTATRARTIHAA